MSSAETPTQRLAVLGLKLPAPWSAPGAATRVAMQRQAASPFALGPGVQVYAEFVRVADRRVLVSGHLPIDQDGRIVGPFGRVGKDVDVTAAKACAQRCMLGIFSSLVRELGSLDRVEAWLRIDGMVNAAPDFYDFPEVINPASKLVYEIFGTLAGRHARVAVGVGGLPFNAPVEIAAELLLKPNVRDAKRGSAAVTADLPA